MALVCLTIWLSSPTAVLVWELIASCFRISIHFTHPPICVCKLKRQPQCFIHIFTSAMCFFLSATAVVWPLESVGAVILSGSRHADGKTRLPPLEVSRVLPSHQWQTLCWLGCMKGSMVAEWLVLLPHSWKIKSRLPSGTLLCRVCTLPA